MSTFAVTCPECFTDLKVGCETRAEAEHARETMAGVPCAACGYVDGLEIVSIPNTS